MHAGDVGSLMYTLDCTVNAIIILLSFWYGVPCNGTVAGDCVVCLGSREDSHEYCRLWDVNCTLSELLELELLGVESVSIAMLMCGLHICDECCGVLCGSLG